MVELKSIRILIDINSGILPIKQQKTKKMAKKNNQPQVGSNTLLDPKGILGMNKIAQLPNADYVYSKFTAEDFRLARLTLIFNKEMQRMYLFNDVVGSKGDPWQRNLFKSYLLGQPVGTVELWFNIDTFQYEVLDAQQRLRTLLAIFNDCVMTPPNLIIDGIDCGNKFYSMLDDKIREKFRQYVFLVTISYISKEDAVERFISINNGNPLTAQDKRSPQVSDFAKYIRNISDFNDSPYKFTKFINVNGKKTFQYFTFSHYGRSLDEVMAYIFMVVLENKIVSYNQPDLNKLYLNMKKNPSIFTTDVKKNFESILKVLDKSIQSKIWDNKKTKKKELQYLLLVINHILSLGGSFTNIDLFIEGFYSSIKKCRKNKNLKYTAPNKEIYDFSTAWRLGSQDGFISFIVDCLLKELNNIGIVYKDDKRTFNRSEIESKLEEQDCKCVYCHKPIQLHESIGDHMIPHSQGGRTIYENLAVSCRPCNSIKSSLPWDGWVHAVKAMNGVDLSNLELDIEELVVNQNV